MFHCNGWYFPWAIAAVSGTHVCGAPVVMSTILNAVEEHQRDLATTAEFFTAAAPPPESVLSQMRDAGFNITHFYDLSAVYGPAVVNDWHVEWDTLPATQQAALKARQGMHYRALKELDALDPKTILAVPRGGKTLGEVMFRGNVMMKGYLQNKMATEAAFRVVSFTLVILAWSTLMAMFN